MSETTNTKTTEDLIAEFEQSEQDVNTAKENLTQAEQNRDEKKAEIEAKIEELKAKFESISQAVTEKVEEAAQEVSEKVEEAKDDWEELAKTDPTEARRQLRKFWIAVSVCAFVVGAGVSFVLF